MGNRTAALTMLAVLPGVATWSDGASARSTSVATGAIQGMVFDSLVASAPLPGAEVTIEGTELAVLTDRAGRFRFDSVPAGRTVLRFYHARLDSLGFGVAPVAVEVADGRTTEAKLATPSPATFHARLCPGPAIASTGVVLGVVRDVDTRAPLPNASVEVRWAEWTAGPDGLVRNERGGPVGANANGAYAACGVPTDVPVVIRATAGSHVTGLIEVDLSRRMFAVRDLGVSVTDSGTSVAEMARLNREALRGDSVRPAGSAALRGTVRGPDGTVVSGVQVARLGLPGTARTSSEGTFTLNRLPSGTQTIDLRAIGYLPRSVTVELRTGERREIDVVLERGDAQSLAPVTIVGRGTSFDRTGYSVRRKAGVGEFITEDQIERRRVFDVTQLLWFVRGAHPGAGGALLFPRPVGLGISQMGRALSDSGGVAIYCAPAFWVDGFFVGRDGGELNTVVRPREVRGIEVYLDPATAPAIYRRPDVPCGLVLIWTKPLLPEPPR